VVFIGVLAGNTPVNSIISQPVLYYTNISVLSGAIGLTPILLSGVWSRTASQK